MPKREWTAKDVEDIIDVGRRIARMLLDVHAPFLAGGPNAKAAHFLAAAKPVQDEAIRLVRSRLLADGSEPSMVEAHIEGALLLIKAGHSLEEAADRSRLH
jgi:hypothetical protein